MESQVMTMDECPHCPSSLEPLCPRLNSLMHERQPLVILLGCRCAVWIVGFFLSMDPPFFHCRLCDRTQAQAALYECKNVVQAVCPTFQGIERNGITVLIRYQHHIVWHCLQLCSVSGSLTSDSFFHKIYSWTLFHGLASRQWRFRIRLFLLDGLPHQADELFLLNWLGY